MSMTREEMLEFIRDRLEGASDADVESVYWMVSMEVDG